MATVRGALPALAADFGPWGSWHLPSQALVPLLCTSRACFLGVIPELGGRLTFDAVEVPL